MMMEQLRELYSFASANSPELHAQLCELDARLAELHRAGIEIQRMRWQLIETLAKHRGLNFISPSVI